MRGNTWGDLDSDTGYDVVAGSLVADGRLPYVDFVYYYGPLAPLLAGLVSVVAGPGIGAIVALGLAITAAIVAATYALARTFVGPLGSFLAAALTTAVAFIPNNYSYVLPHTISATLGTLFLLVLLLCLRQLGSRETLAWAAAGGSALGLLALTKPEPALAARPRSRPGSSSGPGGAEASAATRSSSPEPGSRFPRSPTGRFSPPCRRTGSSSITSSGRHALRRRRRDYPGTRMPLTPGSFVELGGRAVVYALGVIRAPRGRSSCRTAGPPRAPSP